jgi:hypothetical protein
MIDVRLEAENHWLRYGRLVPRSLLNGTAESGFNGAWTGQHRRAIRSLKGFEKARYFFSGE